jgi:hypothetical protein
MILAEVLGHSNVAARGQSREFFNTIGGERTLDGPVRSSVSPGIEGGRPSKSE